MALAPAQLPNRLDTSGCVNHGHSAATNVQNVHTMVEIEITLLWFYAIKKVPTAQAAPSKLPKFLLHELDRRAAPAINSERHQPAHPVVDADGKKAYFFTKLESDPAPPEGGGMMLCKASGRHPATPLDTTRPTPLLPSPHRSLTWLRGWPLKSQPTNGSNIYVYGSCQDVPLPPPPRENVDLGCNQGRNEWKLSLQWINNVEARAGGTRLEDKVQSGSGVQRAISKGVGQVSLKRPSTVLQRHAILSLLRFPPDVTSGRLRVLRPGYLG
ncbi:hypothetical protein BKA70DRAFT_1396813 [Coprinopsis sp. MPI-PUGE-AT-0042]|nr:hypothetical protein BKA70DRAFT_1396813 [Coprinopsis sp. MPI-PUGE-AT-0042]